jgi:hypothetical protein
MRWWLLDDSMRCRVRQALYAEADVQRAFAVDVATWESRFHADRVRTRDAAMPMRRPALPAPRRPAESACRASCFVQVGYNAALGVTYDGTAISNVTGAPRRPALSSVRTGAASV